jgi:hypothetical protein
VLSGIVYFGNSLPSLQTATFSQDLLFVSTSGGGEEQRGRERRTARKGKGEEEKRKERRWKE